LQVGLTNSVVSLVTAAFTVPMPINKTHHVVSYGISGFICGRLSAFMRVFMHMKRAEKAR
jgi:hypothetical protein